MKTVIALLNRARRVVLLSFTLILLSLLALLATRKDKYEAHMSFLLRSARADSLVSADPAQNTLQPDSQNETEEKINSAVELLNNASLLQTVAVENGLEKNFLDSSQTNRAVAIEKATRDLSKHLAITPVRRSSIIDIAYTSTNRDTAKAVLDSLSKQYLRQYSQLYHTSGAAAFYQTRSEALSASLQQAEADRTKLLERNGFAILPDGQSQSLTQLVNLQKSRDETVTSLAETESRLNSVLTQQLRNEDRRVTQRKVAASPVSIDQLNTRLVDLQNRLTEVRAKFVDNDPIVLQVEQQIADTSKALAAAGKMQFEDVTTDINPVRQSLDSQASQLIETKAGLSSRLQELNQQLEQQKVALNGTQQARVELNNLDRTIKVLQDGVSLYESKSLVARASEEMNAENFSNIVEASYPTVPVLPIQSHFTVVTSVLISLLLSLAIGLAYGWWTRNSSYMPEARFANLQTVASN